MAEICTPNKLSNKMEDQPDYQKCLKILETALNTMKYLCLYACPEEKARLELTCEKLSEHIAQLR